MVKVSRDIKRNYRNEVLRKRLQAGFKSQKDFALSLRICPSVLNEIECDKRFLSAPVALRMAEVLGCKLDELYVRRNNG